MMSKNAVWKSAFVLCLILLVGLCNLIATKGWSPELTRFFSRNDDFILQETIPMKIGSELISAGIFKHHKRAFLILGPITGIPHCRFLLLEPERIMWFDDSEINCRLMDKGKIFSVKQNAINNWAELTESMEGWAKKYDCIRKDNTVSYRIEATKNTPEISFTIDNQLF